MTNLDREADRSRCSTDEGDFFEEVKCVKEDCRKYCNSIHYHGYFTWFHQQEGNCRDSLYRHTKINRNFYFDFESRTCLPMPYTM